MPPEQRFATVGFEGVSHLQPGIQRGLIPRLSGTAEGSETLLFTVDDSPKAIISALKNVEVLEQSVSFQGTTLSNEQFSLAMRYCPLVCKETAPGPGPLTSMSFGASRPGADREQSALSCVRSLLMLTIPVGGHHRSLKNVSGTITLGSNPGLTQVNLESLQAVSAIRISDSPNLVNATFPNLREVCSVSAVCFSCTLLHPFHSKAQL